ncbi:MAG: peptidoglycan-binding protein, partial [Patescibacteria group bacterium]|nr:peptidoglycan-binding protein [Patescibacteria group bacterium]
SHALRNTIIVALVVIIAGAAAWYARPRSEQPKFCFDFAENMQFGDHTVVHPINQGTSVHGVTYYIPEVPALQTALKDQGFYIDPYETTGGKVYAGSILGPTTHSAVFAFQKKYGLKQTGIVDNPTLDKLAALYTCPTPAVPASATTTAATTTSAK